MSILILLSTYNGERYLADQIDSIISQTLSDWTLLIRDDASHDSTLTIIRDYMARDSRIQLMQDSLGNLNTRGSFSALMKKALHHTNNYIFFADQDDVWLPGKLENSVAMLQSLEKRHGKHVSALVHSDLRVVDQQLNIIHDSYLCYEGLNRNAINPIKTLLINNYVTGCTMGINRALLEIATPIPDSAFMHDWWCALCAAITGHIGYIDTATILYRQHKNNSIGSSGFLGKIKKSLTYKQGFSRRVNNLRTCFKQAEDLLARTHASDEVYNTLKQFISLPDYPLKQRYVATRHLQLSPASSLRAAMFLFVLAFI